MSMESLVRPFQEGDTEPRHYRPYGQQGVPNTVVHLGRNGGGGKTLSGSLSISISSYMKRYENEKKQQG